MVYGFVPRSPLALTTVPNPSEFHGRAVALVNELTQVHSCAHDNLVVSSDKYKESADRHRREVHFKVGEFVGQS